MRFALVGAIPRHTEQSAAKTSKYSNKDFEAAKVDQEAATELFVYAFGNSLAH
jgi:hypothetical protein